MSGTTHVGAADPPRDAGGTAPFAHYARRRATLLLLTAVFAVHYLDRQILAVLIPPIKAEFGLSDTVLGLLSGFAFTVLFCVVGLAVARIADRFDRARVITAALAAFSVATALCGAATGFWSLLAFRVAVGVGEGGTNPASHALIADLYPARERASAMAAYSIGPYVGVILAFGLGGWLSHQIGWRHTFFVIGGIGVVLAAFTALGLRDPRTAARVPAPRGAMPAREALALLRGSPDLRHLFAAGTLALAGTQGVATWLPALLVREHGMNLAQAGVFLAGAIGVGGGIATYLFGRLTDRLARRDPARKPRLTGLCMGAVALLWLPPLLLGAQVPVVATVLLPAMLTGAYIGPTLAMVQDRVNARARAFSAAVLLVVTNLLGAGAGPLLIGALSDALAARHPAHALSYALLCVPALLLWSAYHYGRAARHARDV